MSVINQYGSKWLVNLFVWDLFQLVSKIPDFLLHKDALIVTTLFPIASCHEPALE